MGVIDRPESGFDGASHTYTLENWDPDLVVGCSTVAKVGGVEETWGIASAWGFRIGYEGAWDVAADEPFASDGLPWSKEELRFRLKERGLTPWSKRDKAAERGNWVHDLLEALAQDNAIPDTSTLPEEVRGHVRSVLGWYVKYRPTFEATEVQIASRTHGFAGRYDIRCWIDARKLVPLLVGHDTVCAERVRALGSWGRPARCLVDLKTSKGVYPTTHFPQLAGYELASVEMGFPATDCQLVLNSRPDGSLADLVASWAEGGDFVAYLGALRAIRRIKAADPEEKRKRLREDAILAALPARSRELAADLPGLSGLEAKEVGRILGGLRKRGLVQQVDRGVWERV